MTTPRSRRSLGDQFPQYVRTAVTESASNTFTQAQVTLPVVLAQGFVVLIHSIDLQIPAQTGPELTATDDESHENIQITRTTQSTLINLDSADLLWRFQIQSLSVAARTAEKAPIHDRILVGRLADRFANPLLWPFPTVFVGYQGTGHATAKTIRLRIGYTTLRLSNQQLPELIGSVA